MLIFSFPNLDTVRPQYGGSCHHKVLKFSLEDARPHKQTGECEVKGCVSDSATISRSPADIDDGSLGCAEQDPICAANMG